MPSESALLLKNNFEIQKPFHVNKESNSSWNPQFKRGSMINYQNQDYNLITGVSMKPRPTTTSHRQRGFSEYLDKSKVINKNLDSSYQDALKSNPKMFHKKSGEFSEHSATCLKLGGNGPFYKPISLLRNR